MLEGSPIGKAKVPGLLSRVSAQGRYSYMLLALAGAAAFFLAAGMNLAFADSSALQHAPDAPAASQGGQTYARQVADSVSVASNFDNPSSRFAARSFVRGMSDGVGVTSEFGGPSGQTAAGTPARIQGPQQPLGQRADAGQRLLLGNNKFEGPLYGSGTIAQSGTPTAEIVAVEADDMDFSELGTLGAGDDPDSHRLLQAAIDASRASSAMEGMAVYASVVNGVYLVAIVAVATSRSRRFASVRTIRLGRDKALVLNLENGRTTRIVIFVAAAAFAAAGAGLQPAFALEIEIESAQHLDSKGRVLGDIYPESSRLDGVWSRIPDGHYVRVTFEQNLESTYDISLYLRVVSGNPRIEIYEKGGTVPVAVFDSLQDNGYNIVYLTGLKEPQNTFDFRVVGGTVEIDHIVDPRTTPTFVAAGTAASGIGTITPALPAGIQTNDILLLFLETSNQAISISNANGGTWTEVTNSPQSAASASGNTRLTVFWSRYNGSQGNPTASDSGNHQLGIILAFRGVDAVGNPWDITSGNVETTSDTSLSTTGATTTVQNTLVVVAAALMDDNPDFGGTWTNSDLANITVRPGASTTQGDDGRIGIITGEKATAGAYGATTNTLTANAVKAMMTIALKGPVSESLSETVTIADSAARMFVGSKSNPDTLTIADSISAVKTAPRSVSETIGFSDSIERVKTPLVPLSESIQITDSMARQFAGLRPPADSVTFSDSLSRVFAPAKSISDALTVGVSVSRSETNIAAIAYRSDDGANTSMSPKYREWNVVTRSWGEQVELESSGSPIRNAWLEFSPVSSKRVIVVLSTDGTLDSYVCDNGCTDTAQWTVTHDIVDLWTTELAATKRPFDIEYENTSGDLLLVYDKEIVGDGITTDLYYRIMPDFSHTFGSEESFDDSGLPLSDPEYSFVRMDARRTTGSDDIGIVALSTTNNRSVAWYWTGSTNTVGSENELTSSLFVHDYEAIGIGFETFTGHLIAITGEGTSVKYSEFDGTSWTEEASVGAIDVGTVRWIRYVPNANAGSSSGFLAVSGFTGTQHQLDSAHWGGTAWTVYAGGTRHDSNIDDSATRAFDFAWDNSADATRGILVYGTTSGSITFKRYAEFDTWTAATSFSDDGTHPWVALNENSNPTAADVTSVLGAGIDSDADIGGLNWDGAPPVVNPTSTGDDGITPSGSTAYESFRIDYRRSTLIKKGLPVALAITDQITVKIPHINIYDSLAATDSVLVEKGTLGSSSAAAAVYKSETGAALLNSPKYREWDPATQTFSSEVELANIGSPMRDGKIRFSPDSALRAIVTHSDDGTLNLFKCDNMCTTVSSWTHANADFADTGTPAGYSTEPYRPYDTMFEATGERMMIVYDKEEIEDADFYYRTYNGTHLSAESSFNLGGTSDNEVLRYFRLAAHPTTNEMVLTVMDATGNKSYALVWDGTTWTNQITLSSSLSADNKDGESIGVAYEASGAAVAVSGNGANSLAYARWSGSWSSVSTVDPNPASGNDVKFVSVRGDPAMSSNRVMVCQSDDLSDLACSQFSAGSPGSWAAITSDVGTVDGRAFDYVYHPSGTTGMLMSATPSAGSLEYRVFDGSGFGSTYAVSAAGTHRWISASPSYSGNDYVNALFLESDSNFDTGALKYKANVVTLIGDSSLTANSQNENHEGLHHEFQKSKRVKRAVADTVSFADAVSRTTGRNIPDLLNIIDMITRTINVARAPEEALPVGDAISKQGVFFRSTADTLAMAETLERVAHFVRSASETLAVTETPARRYHGLRSLSEALDVQDNAARAVHYHRSRDETLGVADSTVRTVTLMKTHDDSLSVADSITRIYAGSRAPSDSVSASDEIAKRVVALRATNDAVGVADAITYNVAFHRAASDTATVADSVDRMLIAARSTLETVNLNDDTNRVASFTGAASDTVSITDTVARKVEFAISVSDALSVTDLLSAKVVARNISDTLTIADAVTAKVGSRNVADLLAVSDTLSARVSGRSAFDTLAVTDDIKASVNLRLVETLSVADAITTSTTHTTGDALSVSDSVDAKAATRRTISDSVALDDGISKSVAYRIADTLLLSDQVTAVLKPAIFVNESVTVVDSIRTLVTRAISDAVTVQDSVRPTSTIIHIADSVSMTDVARITSKTVQIADSVGIADSARTTSLALHIADSVAVVDAARTTSVAINIADALAIADGARPTSAAVNVADSLSVADQIKTVVPPRTAEQVTITDAISLHVNRIVTDAMSMSDMIATGSSTHYTRDVSDSLAVAEPIVMTFGKAVNLADSLTVTAPLTNISVHWNRIFAEGLDVGAPVCLPNQCLHNIVLGEAFQLGAAFSPPPQVADIMTLTDSITRGIRGSSVPHPSDTVTFSDGVTAQIIGILVVDKKEYAGPLPSTPISGNFTYTGDAANLKAQIQPAPIPINSTVVRPNLPGDVTILRTYHVPIVPNAAIPGDDAIVTETQKEVPALSNMFMRLNFEETPQLSEHEKFIKTLDIEFTPKVDSTDFGLVVSVIDGPPGAAPIPAEELRPIYVDVRWVGSFPGSESPAVQTYYQNPPTFTFTVNDQWVQEQEANRDSNGVPTLKLWLLNDDTNKWEQITSITRPVAGKDGTYMFVATLPHFSDYAITATRAPKAPSSGGNQQPQPPVTPDVPPVALAINLLESIALGDQQQSVPIEVIEEFGQKKLSVSIADAVAIFSKPVSYKTFQVGDVNVRITVQDVKQESVIPPKATATFLVELDNLGNNGEEFTLNFWYYDQSGKKPYESSQVAAIGPYESKQLLVDVPFTEPGVFEVTAEARSIPGDDLVNTVQLTVTIPWLAINLYVLVVVAVAILGVSGGVMAVLLRGGLAGAGAGTALFLLAKKPKPTIRVTDRLAAIEDEYDVVVEVRQKEARGAQAVFDLEIVNRSKRTREFMLKYWAADLSGIKMSEHVERIRIKGRTTEVKAVQVVLPPGQNVFVVEAGPVSEKQERWSHAGVRVKAG